MRYLLVRHIRDQPTGTLILAIVISPFLLQGTFIFGTCYESFVPFPPFIPGTETVRDILVLLSIDLNQFEHPSYEFYVHIILLLKFRIYIFVIYIWFHLFMSSTICAKKCEYLKIVKNRNTWLKKKICSALFSSYISLISNEALGFDVKTKSSFRSFCCLFACARQVRARCSISFPCALYELQIFGKFSLGKFSTDSARCIQSGTRG